MKLPFGKYRQVLTPEEKKSKKKERLLALASGLMLGLAFPPIPGFFLVFVALVPYFFALEKRESLGNINRLTYLTAFVMNLITIYWVGSWTPEADPFLMISGALLLFVNPVFFLIPSTLYYFCKKVFNRSLALYLFPLFWVTYEFAYTVTDFRFPWLTLGNSQPYFKQFIQIADIIGVYGLSLIILYTNVFVFLAVRSYRNKQKSVLYPAIAVALVIVPVIYGIVRINTFELPEETVRVGIVQPDLNPWNKWDAGNIHDQMELYFDLTEENLDKGAELVLWPETALPVYLLTTKYEEEAAEIRKFVNENNFFLLTGMPDATFYFNREKAPEDAKPTSSGHGAYTSYNSILLFAPNTREIKKYGKMKLVPFGEKVPLVDYIPFLGDLIKWNVGISSWNTGKDTVVFDMPLDYVRNNPEPTYDTLKVGGVICIESIYPDFTSSFALKGAGFIAVVTNDSWYGNSSGPRQHKEIATLRAVENRKSVVRAANGGISAFIDPLGNITAETELFTRTTATHDVHLNYNTTFYSRHPMIIPYGVSAISVWMIGLFVLMKINTRIKSA